MMKDINPLTNVAFHPNGYMIATGFKTKIHIYHLMWDQLRTYKDLDIKHTTCIRYSRGGQYLAVAFTLESSDKYKNTLNIYDSYTLECVFDKNTGVSKHLGPTTKIVDM